MTQVNQGSYKVRVTKGSQSH